MIPIHHQRKGYVAALAARMAGIRWNVNNGTAARKSMGRDMSPENARAIIESRLELENEPASDDQEINRLATLTPVQYSRERKIAAQKLGIGVAVLDHAVKMARSDSAEHDRTGAAS